MSDYRELSDIIQAVVAPGMKPKELIAAVRKQHPEATKKAIVRAAFYALTSGMTISTDKVRDLHSFALSERADASDDDSPPRKSKKKRHLLRS